MNGSRMIPGHRTFKLRSETRGKSARGRQHFRSPENSQGRPETHEISGRTASAPRAGGRTGGTDGDDFVFTLLPPRARSLTEGRVPDARSRRRSRCSRDSGARAALRPAARQVSADLRDAWAGLWPSCSYEPSTHGAGRREGRGSVLCPTASGWTLAPDSPLWAILAEAGAS